MTNKYELNKPGKHNWRRNDTDRNSITVLQRKHMHHIPMKCSPVSKLTETVIAQCWRSDCIRHTINCGRSLQVTVLFVVCLMETFQILEILSTPRFQCNRTRYCHFTNVRIEIERWQTGRPDSFNFYVHHHHRFISVNIIVISVRNKCGLDL